MDGWGKRGERRGQSDYVCLAWLDLCAAKVAFASRPLAESVGRLGMDCFSMFRDEAMPYVVVETVVEELSCRRYTAHITVLRTLMHALGTVRAACLARFYGADSLSVPLGALLSYVYRAIHRSFSTYHLHVRTNSVYQKYHATSWQAWNKTSTSFVWSIKPLYQTHF